jgi:hypothetical protein
MRAPAACSMICSSTATAMLEARAPMANVGNRQIAAEIGVDHKTVAKTRTARTAEGYAEISGPYRRGPRPTGSARWRWRKQANKTLTQGQRTIVAASAAGFADRARPARALFAR